MRLFFAIPIPPDIVAAVTPVQHKLAATRADVRWVDPALYHITVKFLGETDDALVPELSARLDKAAAQVPAFELEVEGIDRLPERGPTRVITSRILSVDQRITKLHRLIDSAIGGIGLAMDTRVFVPHLTLGRVSSNHGLNRLLRLLEKHDLDFFGKFLVERVSLMHSSLGSGTDGSPTYRALHTATLIPQPAEADVPTRNR